MDRLVLLLATLGPIGRKLPAPGTFGSLVGLGFYYLLLAPGAIDPAIIHSAFGILALLSIPICGKAARLLNKKDPQEVILDKFVAQPLVFLGVQWSAVLSVHSVCLVLGLGFALFRVLDILKPLGIGRLQHLPGGTGIVADDIAASLVAAPCLWWICANLPLS